MSIGDKIKNERKKKNLSQEDLASILDVSRQTISKWEVGESNPDFDKIVPLCDFFGISTDELLKDNKPVLEEKIEAVSKKNKALTYSMCIIIFIVMCILIIIFDSVGIDDVYIATTSLVSIGAISVILVYYYLSKPLEKIPKMPNNKNKLISSIINLGIIISYFICVFIWGWDYTWIILIVGLLIKKIIFLSLLLKSEGENYEK